MTSDRDLLARYANDGSRQALGELAARYLDMVYAAARRQVGGDTALAEDVTQAVFLMFATKAPALRGDVIVPAWLLRATWYASRNALRLQQRRRVHEARVAAMNSRSRAADVSADPASAAAANDADTAAMNALIDRALMSLRERDRAAVAMHYLRGQTFEQVAAELQTTPEAARKRIERAIAKLRSRFASAGVASVSPAAIGSALTAAARVNAPSPLLAAVTSALAEPSTAAASAATVAEGAIGMMAMAKVRLACAFALAAAVLVAVGIVGIVAATQHRHTAEVTAGPTTTTTATTTPASAGPLDALQRLAAAVRDGDGTAARSLAAVTGPADEAFLDLAAENIRLAGLFKSAYRDTFGAGAADALPADWYPTVVAANARVTINGDRATVVWNEGPVPMVKVDGQWKVPSSFVTVENQGNWPSSSPQAVELVRLNNLAYAEATHAIARGRLKSPEQARADLRDRLSRAKVAAAAAARSPSPTTHATAQPAGP